MELEIDFSNLRFDEDWIAALTQIVIFATSKTDANEDDNDELQKVLQEFRLELPDRTTLSPIREIAAKVANVVMIDIIDESIQGIKRNNAELSKLVKKLGEQIKDANADAQTLKKITAEIEKAIKVVETAKELIENLNEPNLIKKFEAIIDALKIFKEFFKE